MATIQYQLERKLTELMRLQTDLTNIIKKIPIQKNAQNDNNGGGQNKKATEKNK